MTDRTALFQGPGFRATALAASQLPQLQALFDANPGYFQAIHGRPAWPQEAQAEFDELPPPHLHFSQRWVLGIFDDGGALLGVLVLVADLGAAGVWHIALLLIDQARHGSGLAGRVLAALQAWALASGALWLRLGVVVGNQRAERFWARHGFAQTRLRRGIDTGGRLNDLRVMIKPLAGGTLADYLALVPRDQPEADLP
jgi:RimJ/RimL family protein N-acetyltransferase